MKPTVVAPTKLAPLLTVDEAKVPPTDFVLPMVATPSVHVTAKPKWSWCHVSTSMFATLCCFPACGLMGLVYAVLSYVDHKSTDYRRSAKKRRHAWGWTITSLVFGLLLWGLFIYSAVRFYVPYMKAMHHQKEPNRMMSYPSPKTQYSKDLLEKMAHRMNEMEMPKLKEPSMFGGGDHDMKKHGSDMMETEEERRRHRHGHHDGRHGDHDSHDSDSDDDDHP